MRTSILVLLSAIVCAASSSAQDSIPDARRIVAVRASAPIRVDGRLEEGEWARARFVDDFTQKDPVEGVAPSERTELAVLYDEHALYIGARLHRRDPSRIHRAVTRRDDVGNTERLIVALDTYHDRRTAYSFSVTAAGARTDYYHAEDAEFSRDFSFDPVWDAATEIGDSGWTVEMRIPFSQLRFNDEPEPVWGINIDRWVPDLNEDIYWVMIPKNENGWASRFGELVGLRGIHPSARIELLPYVAGQIDLPDEADPDDPFDDRFGGRAGLDLKMGLGPNVTLDATVNPDFGQVEADPAVVNLSAFESFFDERRPFFIEGSQLLSGGGASYFYSRRIGAPPRYSPPGTYVDAPENSTILGAAKVSGRLASGLSIGALTAITERERAIAYDASTNSFDTVEVEPLTGYGAVRLQQELGATGSTIGATATVVRRDMTPGTAPERGLTDLAISGGVESELRLDDGAWSVEAYAGGSHVRGDSNAIERLQRSSARYYDRPDADYVELDPSLRSMSGYTMSANVSKNTGRWRGYAGASAESPGLELNDIGRLGTADDIDAWAGVSYVENEPGELLRSYRVGLSLDAGWNFGGIGTYRSINADASATLPSFWSLGAWGGISLPAQNDNLSRGGPLMGSAFGGHAGINVSSPYTDRVRGWMSVNTTANAIGGWSLDIDPGVSLEVGDRLTLSLSPHLSRSQTPRQYIGTIDGESAGGGERTYGMRYVFSWIDQTYLSAQLRMGFVITPDLSLDLYAETFAGAGRFYGYGELPEPRTTDIRRYESSGATLTHEPEGTILVEDRDGTFRIAPGDFTYTSFRANVVLRWEWLPGSTAYLVWQRGAEGFVGEAERIGPRHLVEPITASGSQAIALKVSYWLSVD